MPSPSSWWLSPSGGLRHPQTVPRPRHSSQLLGPAHKTNRIYRIFEQGKATLRSSSASLRSLVITLFSLTLRAGESAGLQVEGLADGIGAEGKGADLHFKDQTHSSILPYV